MSVDRRRSRRAALRKIARRAFATVIVLSVVLGSVLTVRALRTDSAQYFEGLGADVEAQHAFLHERLHDGGPLPRRTMLTHTLYGFSLVDAVLAAPADQELRTRTVTELRWIVQRLDDPALRTRYTATQVPHGVYYFGQRNLLLAGLARVDAELPVPLAQEFHENSRQLFEAYSASPFGHLESYPEHIWPADNVVALYSLAVHDRLFGTHYRAAVDRWLDAISQRLDPTTGLIPSKLHFHTGEAIMPPRGVNLAYSIAFLADLAPEVARDQYEGFRQHFFDRWFGLVTVREYRRGTEGAIDVDSGPIVLGLGAGANGLALAAAKAMADEETFSDLLVWSELLGLPMSRQDRKRYLFGIEPIADAVIVWGKTRRGWLGPPTAGS